jgi:hypothetical protein
LEEAADRAAANVPPAPQGPLLDAADAELCRWGVRECDTPGVMTGCDARQEWLLPWWWRHYRRHNDYPVAFADLGMTPAARAWCAQRGSVVDVGPVAQPFEAVQAQAGKPVPPGWFAKPLAILRSPFRWTLWLDADCEVRGPLAEAFAYADRGLAVTPDPYYPEDRNAGRPEDRNTGMPDDRETGRPEDGVPHRYSGLTAIRSHGIPAIRSSGPTVFRSSGHPVLSTGVVGVRHGEPAVQTWAAQVFRRLERIRDDQAALNEIRDVHGDRIVLMPRRFQHLRLAGDAGPDAIVVHWTGPEGKRLIQEKIGRDATCPERSRGGNAGDADKGEEQRQSTRESEELIHVG